VSEPGAERRGAAALWTTVVAMCLVCCAGPLLAVLTAVGLTAAMAAVFIPALAVVAAAAAFAVWWLRRRRSRTMALARQSPGRVVIAVSAQRRYDSVDSVGGPSAAGPQRSAASREVAGPWPPADTEAR
jgi:hypothetical protein